MRSLYEVNLNSLGFSADTVFDIAKGNAIYL